MRASTEFGDEAQCKISPHGVGEGFFKHTLVAYEVGKFVLRTRGEPAFQKFSKGLAGSEAVITELDIGIAEEGARVSLLHGLAMADAIIYATARAHDAELWTQDVDFDGLPGVRYFAKAI